MNNLKIKAEARKILGRKVKTLRSEGKLPANVYGKDFKSTAIVVDTGEFEKVFKEAGETSVVEVLLGGKTIPTLVHLVQVHPVTDSLVHVDFRKVDLTKKVTANIPVGVVGESPAEKQGLGTMVQVLDEVEVEALPGDLPENFEVDVAELAEVDATILVGSIKTGTKVKILTDPEQLIVKVEALREEEAEPEPVVETEVTQGEEAKEGEGAKEGDEDSDKEEKTEDSEGEKGKENENSTK